jgi:hypothetical protein
MDVTVEHLFVGKNVLVQQGRQWQEIAENLCGIQHKRYRSEPAMRGKTVVVIFCCFHIKCSWVRPLSEDGIARGYALWGSVGRCWNTVVQVSWMSHSSLMKHTFTLFATLTDKMPDSGLRRIQGLPLPSHCIQRDFYCYEQISQVCRTIHEIYI